MSRVRLLKSVDRTDDTAGSKVIPAASQPQRGPSSYPATIRPSKGGGATHRISPVTAEPKSSSRCSSRHRLPEPSQGFPRKSDRPTAGRDRHSSGRGARRRPTAGETYRSWRAHIRPPPAPPGFAAHSQPWHLAPQQPRAKEQALL